MLPQIDDHIKCNDYGDYKGSASNHNKIIDNVIEVLINKQNVHTNSIISEVKQYTSY